MSQYNSDLELQTTIVQELQIQKQSEVFNIKKKKPSNFLFRLMTLIIMPDFSFFFKAAHKYLLSCELPAVPDRLWKLTLCLFRITKYVL